jgi:uncharacterized protein YndB with AHSA1/START domain
MDNTGSAAGPGSSDRIEKSVLLAAPQARVWRALTDATEFGRWFRVALDGPFVHGASLSGQVTYPGYEHLRFTVQDVTLEPQRRFAFRWHPAAVEPGVDYSAEPTTLVEFHRDRVGL